MFFTFVNLLLFLFGSFGLGPVCELRFAGFNSVSSNYFSLFHRAKAGFYFVNGGAAWWSHFLAADWPAWTRRTSGLSSAGSWWAPARTAGCCRRSPLLSLSSPLPHRRTATNANIHPFTSSQQPKYQPWASHSPLQNSGFLVPKPGDHLRLVRSPTSRFSSWSSSSGRSQKLQTQEMKFRESAGSGFLCENFRLPVLDSVLTQVKNGRNLTSLLFLNVCLIQLKKKLLLTNFHLEYIFFS